MIIPPSLCRSQGHAKLEDAIGLDHRTQDKAIGLDHRTQDKANRTQQ